MDARALKALEYDKIKKLLIARAETSLGVEVLERLKPLADLAQVSNRLRETSEGRAFLHDRGSPPFAGADDIAEPVRLAALGGVLETLTLLRIRRFTEAARAITRYFAEPEPEAPLVRAIAARLDPLDPLTQRLRRCISDEGEVQDDASDELHRLRRALSRAQQHARERARSLATSTDKEGFLQEAVVALRNERFCLPVKAEHASFVKGIVHDRSASGATLFIEPVELVELNNRTRELFAAERDELERILRELSGEVGQQEEPLLANQQALGLLDAIFARARLAESQDAVEPKMALSGPVLLRRARHPLLPADGVVPIDFELGEDYQALLVTGPNTGGKTVSLKTVGLIQLMAQSGLHITADAPAQLRCFEKIFADIGDEQSLEQSLSTFSAHLSYQIAICKQASTNSLVLLDELGAGTDPSEGASLAKALLEHLLAAGALIVATTHYNDLKVFAFNHPLIENASVEFNPETLRPTYKLLMGVPGSSQAFHIASRLGLPGEIIKAAKEHRGLEATNLETVMKKMENARRRLEQERNLAIRLRRDYEKQSAKLEADRALFERERKEAASKGFTELKNRLASIRNEALGLLKDLAETSDKRKAERSYSELRRLEGDAQILESELRTELAPERQQPAPETLAKGDRVRLVGLDLEGTVIEPPNEKDEVLVSAGALSTWVRRADLRLAKGGEVTGQRLADAMARKRFLSVPTELNLIGKRVEDALVELDSWLEEAALAGHPEVRVVHGKGTGALRTGVHEYLRRSRLVSSFDIAPRDQGGTGATVIVLAD